MPILIRQLTRSGHLPASFASQAPEPKQVPLQEHTAVVIRQGHSPVPAMTLELAGLPRPGGGELVVSLERLPFHQSPGRWHFRCPCCDEPRGVLVEVAVEGTPRANPVAVALGWACRTCAGLPKSRAWPLSVSERLDNALDRAGEIRRKPGEKARDWRRRRQRAQDARRKAGETDALIASRLGEEQGF